MKNVIIVRNGAPIKNDLDAPLKPESEQAVQHVAARIGSILNETSGSVLILCGTSQAIAATGDSIASITSADIQKHEVLNHSNIIDEASPLATAQVAEVDTLIIVTCLCKATQLAIDLFLATTGEQLISPPSSLDYANAWHIDASKRSIVKVLE